MENKLIYEVSTNTDLTEGRGGKKHVAYCENIFTAYRLAKGIGVQGGDGYIDEVVAYKIDGNRWYAPVTILWPDEEDVARKNLDDKIKIAVEKAKKAGLSQEEIQLLSQNKT